ncbi:hypothetical protein [Pseudoroseicyclus tamaricis]|uniref:hypothetical protein n=1 Tax=Pseudoroseicyclus tamaricis TaxID=2705421 RepID=UPI001432D1BA|nr:hypothetical protein [Pseudoroseicyclus tamaricis]
MLFSLAGLLIGAALGAWRARARGGVGKDIAQWAAVWGMIGLVLGTLLTIIVVRTGG